MKLIYLFLEENAEECQDELIDQIERERPQPRTVRNRLFEKNRKDVLIAERSFKHTTISLKNTGHKVLTSTWYHSRSSDPQVEKLRMVKVAAEVIQRTYPRKCTIQYNSHHPTTSSRTQIQLSLIL